jgi:hypothetical protein
VPVLPAPIRKKLMDYYIYLLSKEWFQALRFHPSQEVAIATYDKPKKHCRQLAVRAALTRHFLEIP